MALTAVLYLKNRTTRWGQVSRLVRGDDEGRDG